MLHPSHEAIAARVLANEGAMRHFLEELVNIESPTEDRDLCGRAGDFLVAKAASLGMECTRDAQERFADNRIARLYPARRQTSALRVLMIGHFDTVYPRGTVVTRPYHVVDGRAYGCGVLDMKSGLTSGLFALQALQETLGEVPVAVTFIFNSDEEIGSPCSRNVIAEETARHDLALVLEPRIEGPSVVMTRKGVGIWHLTVDGIEAHAGVEPEKGANALVEMAHKILAVSALASPRLGTTVNVGVISGGTKPYVVPGNCRLELDIRVPSASEQARVEAGLRQIADEVIVPRTVTKLTGSFHRPPMESSDASRAYLVRLQDVAAAFDAHIGSGGSGGASDGNLTASAGLPTIDGMGALGGRPHSPDEFLDLASLTQSCQVLATYLASLGTSGD